jgi:hypothetical protein
MTPGTTAIACPSCQKRLRVPDGLTARVKVSCPNCGHVFRLVKRRTAKPAGRNGPTETAEHDSTLKLALLLLTPCLVAVLGGMAVLAKDDSSNAQDTTAAATSAVDTTQITGLASTESPQAAPDEGAGAPSWAAEPANDTWKVGELVMAQWSADDYWYPARIEKIAGNSFVIKHLDGTEDTVSADKLAKDSLQEGDRVAVDWKREGRYYSGKILSREGDALRIQYDDEDEENTTIASVRIWPNGKENAVRHAEEPVYHEQYAGNGRDHRADLQAYLNGEAQLHRMYAAQARQQEADIRAEAQQMQNDIMNRQYYEGLNRLNNAVPGFQPWPY